MADPGTPGSGISTPADSPAGESKAQREARLRRERRNAKLQTGGSERLSKITSLSGRPAAAEAELNRETTPSKAPPSARQNDSTRAFAAEDPDEVDISNMFARGPPNPNGQGADDAMRSQQDMLRAMLRAPEPGAGGNASGGAGGEDAAVDDPLMKMMQQMLGGGEGGQGGAPGGLPPGLADLLNGQGTQDAEQSPASSSDYIWRIVHVLTSLLIGVYAASNFAFSGSRLERIEAGGEQVAAAGTRLFYLFATAEVALQTTRYLVDRGRLPSSGLVATVAGFLPRPYCDYLRTLNRYSIIYTTVSRDVFVLIFVLGAVAWWKSSGSAAS